MRFLSLFAILFLSITFNLHAAEQVVNADDTDGVEVDSGNNLTVDAGVTLSNTASTNTNPVTIQGNGSTITNNGIISSNNNIASIAGNATTGGTIINNGTITNTDPAAAPVRDSEAIKVGDGYTITNNGTLSTSGYKDIVIMGNNCTFTNNNGATVTGVQCEGINVTGSGNTVNNAGTIITPSFAVYGQSANVNNTGTMDSSSGGEQCIWLHSGNIVNSGTIKGAAAILQIPGGGGLVIENQVGGSLIGGGPAISVTSSVSITNAGTITGVTGVNGSNDADSIVNSGSIVGTGGTAIDFKDGDDSLTLESGYSITGGVDGGAGTDTLRLGSGVTFNGTISNFESLQSVGSGTSSIAFAADPGFSKLSVFSGSTLNSNIAANVIFANAEIAGTFNQNSGNSITFTTLNVTNGNTGNLGGSGVTGVTTANIAGTLNYTATSNTTFSTVNLNGTLNQNSGNNLTVTDFNVVSGANGNLGGSGVTGVTTANIIGTLNYTATSDTTFATLNLSGILNQNSANNLNITSLNVANGVNGVLGGNGSGTLAIDNACTAEGNIIINRAVTFNNGLTITNSGSLGGSGIITGSVVTNGTMSPGNSIGTLNIAGNYTQNVGSTYNVEIAATGESDKISATGIATLNGGTVKVTAFDPESSYSSGTKYTILTAAGGVNGTFASVIDTARLDFSLNYDANNAYLTVDKIATYSNLAATGNQTEIGSSLDQISNPSGDIKVVLDQMDLLSKPDLQSALQQLTPDICTSFFSASTTANNQFFGAVQSRISGRLAGLRLDSGSTSSDAFLSCGGDPEKFGYAMASIPATLRQEWQFYGKVFSTFAEQDTVDGNVGYDLRVNGATFGCDKSFQDRLLVGLAMGGAWANIDYDDRGSSGDVDSFNTSLYASYYTKKWHIDAAAGYAYNNYDSNRRILFGGIDRTASSEHEGDELFGSIGGGYELKLGAYSFEPTLKFGYRHLDEDSFSESGAGSLNLKVDDNESESLTSRLGFKLRKRCNFRDITFIPEVRAEWMHEFKDERVEVSSRLSGGGGSFTTTGHEVDENRALLGIGFTGVVNEDFSAFLDYDAELGNDFQSHTIQVGFRWNF